MVRPIQPQISPIQLEDGRVEIVVEEHLNSVHLILSFSHPNALASHCKGFQQYLLTYLGS